MNYWGVVCPLALKAPSVSNRPVMNSRFALAVRLVAMLALSFAPTAPLVAQRGARPDGAIAPATLDSLRAHIRRVLDSTRTPSVAVAVAKNGRIIWEEGFGFADVERRTPATPTTLYSMASISKPMTATAVMKLAEQGKIDLDRPANDYLGSAKISGLAGPASGATVRRVLSHTAGLPLHYRFFYEGGSVTRPSMDEAITRYAVTVFPPGAVYSYSNLGYGVLENHLRDQRPVLKDSTLDAMHRLATPGDTANGYGLGWLIGNEQGMRVVSHTGGMPGVATSLKLYPQHNVVIVALANTGGATPHRIALDIAAAVIPGYKAPTPGRTPPVPAVAFASPAELIGEWTGTVRSYDGTTTPIALVVKSDDVHVRLGGPDSLWTVLNAPTFRDRVLSGRFAGTIPSEEARRFPHAVGVALLVQGDSLRGWAAAMTTDDPLTGAMSSYAELTRKGAAPER